ncbi:hypothetical protein NLJ89_g5917 [Agrocybe chaxingu]|uniref:Uncharacterized protein n=1 Tax=Agrocybe chaxingu TaxID=84603 RepID=A0A9W8MWI3_9AGAR|nr:hypothetical protein NLJ89_g5917 [Agrocybe chaxingu]
MPPRPAKVYHILVKSHKLSIMLHGQLPTTTVAELKNQVLSALTSNVASDALDIAAMDPPEVDVQAEDDFELCRPIKEKGKAAATFEILEPQKILRECGIGGWEPLFLQFRDPGTGQLSPVQYTLPSMLDEEDEPQAPPEGKGKRKAPAGLDEDDLDI